MRSAASRSFVPEICVSSKIEYVETRDDTQEVENKDFLPKEIQDPKTEKSQSCQSCEETGEKLPLKAGGSECHGSTLGVNTSQSAGVIEESLIGNGWMEGTEQNSLPPIFRGFQPYRVAACRKEKNKTKNSSSFLSQVNCSLADSVVTSTSASVDESKKASSPVGIANSSNADPTSIEESCLTSCVKLSEATRENVALNSLNNVNTSQSDMPHKHSSEKNCSAESFHMSADILDGQDTPNAKLKEQQKAISGKENADAVPNSTLNGMSKTINSGVSLLDYFKLQTTHLIQNFLAQQQILFHEIVATITKRPCVSLHELQLAVKRQYNLLKAQAQYQYLLSNDLEYLMNRLDKFSLICPVVQLAPSSHNVHTSSLPADSSRINKPISPITSTQSTQAESGLVAHSCSTQHPADCAKAIPENSSAISDSVCLEMDQISSKESAIPTNSVQSDEGRCLSKASRPDFSNPKKLTSLVNEKSWKPCGESDPGPFPAHEGRLSRIIAATQPESCSSYPHAKRPKKDAENYKSAVGACPMECVLGHPVQRYPQPDTLSASTHFVSTGACNFSTEENISRVRKVQRSAMANTIHQCDECQSNVTPQWRYLDSRRLCNACYMRAKRQMAAQRLSSDQKVSQNADATGSKKKTKKCNRVLNSSNYNENNKSKKDSADAISDGGVNLRDSAMGTASVPLSPSSPSPISDDCSSSHSVTVDSTTNGTTGTTNNAPTCATPNASMNINGSTDTKPNTEASSPTIMCGVDNCSDSSCKDCHGVAGSKDQQNDISVVTESLPLLFSSPSSTGPQTTETRSLFALLTSMLSEGDIACNGDQNGKDLNLSSYGNMVKEEALEESDTSPGSSVDVDIKKEECAAHSQNSIRCSTCTIGSKDLSLEGQKTLLNGQVVNTVGTNPKSNIHANRRFGLAERGAIGIKKRRRKLMNFTPDDTNCVNEVNYRFDSSKTAASCRLER